MNAVEAGIDLIRRLPPSNVKENVDVIANMLSKNDPEDALDFRAAVDIPLVVIIPKDGSKAFLGCEYNREGLPESPDEVSYRSPWTNTFFPTEVKDGIKPADALRQLELKMANAMDIYRDLYYSTAGSSSCTSYSSTYLWEQDAQAFAGAVLFKKTCNTWDALHVFEAQTSARTGSKVNYKLTSTVILSIKSDESEISLSGSLTRQTESAQSLTNQDSHIGNIGRMIEEIENTMRAQIESVYFGKTRDIVHSLRSVQCLQEVSGQRSLLGELMGKLNKPKA